MAEEYLDTEAAYEAIRKVVEDEEEPMDHVVLFLKMRVPHYDWVGIYAVDGKDLVLKTFVGRPTEHIRIPVGEGICGAAVEEEQAIVIQDVLSEPRYIACSTQTRSEIVVPIFKDEKPVAEIDIDSDTPNAFTDWDREFLEGVARLLAPLF